MSQPNNSHKRISLHFSDTTKENRNNDIYYFAVNPENFSYEKPQRSTLLKTKSSMIVEDFGKDVETITFSGTTGYRYIAKADGTYTNGKQRLQELDDKIERYAKSSGGSGNTPIEMRFYNISDGYAKLVTLAPQGFKITRSKDEPLLYRYEITLYVQGDAWQTTDNAKIPPELGNVNPSHQGNYTNNVNGLPSSTLNQMNRNGTILDNSTVNYGKNTDSNNGNTSDRRLQKHIDNLNRDNNAKNAGKKIYNPNQNTNGVRGVVNDMALTIGYANGGVR